MANRTVLEELDSKISLILEKYEALKEEEEMKELELEDITLRLSKSMGLEESEDKMSIAS